VAVHPNGTRAYVGWFNGVAVLDGVANALIGTVGPGEGFGLAVNPQGTRLYATDRYTYPYQVRVIDTATDTVVATVPLPVQPTGAVASPDGSRVYVAATFGGKVLVIDAASNVVSGSLDLCAGDFGGIGIAVHPNGGRVYVSVGSALCVIDTSTALPIARIPLNLYASWGVAINPSGTAVYVAGVTTYSGGPGQVSVVDTATNSVVATPQFALSAEGVSVHPDGTRVYATSRFPGGVTVINARDNSVMTTIALTGEPMAFGNFIAPLPAAVTSVPVPMLSSVPLAALTLIVLAMGVVWLGTSDLGKRG
jgi:YVTN family beta-propeller protein